MQKAVGSNPTTTSFGPAQPPRSTLVPGPSLDKNGRFVGGKASGIKNSLPNQRVPLWRPLKGQAEGH
ncbi:hypothetical protein EXN66_Car017643 [Channa argus]|uniref:Uncharacterized protein n=1 Tax=Channa argus TaxID=215402 RepID=A0A6G1QHC2_CHAAH|nr:hypothetical protein EXN66_Car017643 [Channa argus]